ncbi:methylesterase 10-like [Hevea brasiliensis]|uniref:methylesterase 10-like n=1 Tax=Hevea brasiliensis TaxID=3981 RepID=UPI0025DC02CB|nr:methylesterase 10-like [Hevea brasiliensis]
MESGKRFVFVHGAWCWYKLVNILKLVGHQVTALDLGACGVDMKQLDEISSISDHVHPQMEFMDSLPRDKKVVLVGPSYGGLCISLAMENFPKKISVAIFVSAYMPHLYSSPGTLIQQVFRRTSTESLMDCHFTFANGLENPPTSAIFGREYLKAKLYKHCKPEDLELAKKLIRPTGLFVEDFANDSLLTEMKFGSVNRVFAVCKEDEVMEEFQEFMIRKSPPKEVKVIKECGHTVMLSKPKELCLCIKEIAHKYGK